MVTETVTLIKWIDRLVLIVKDTNCKIVMECKYI